MPESGRNPNRLDLAPQAYLTAKDTAMALVRRREWLAKRASFWDWFQGSAAVDSKGEPLRLFHGTDAEFARFSRTEDFGFHFGTAETANARLRDMAFGDDAVGGFGCGSNVRPVYLSIKRPLCVPDLHDWEPSRVTALLRENGVISSDQADSATLVDRPCVKRWMFASGYDGFVYRNETERGGDSWIALDAGQIRPWFSRGIGR